MTKTNKMEAVLMQKMGMNRRQAKKATKTAKNFAYDVGVHVAADITEKAIFAAGKGVGAAAKFTFVTLPKKAIKKITSGGSNEVTPEEMMRACMNLANEAEELEKEVNAKTDDDDEEEEVVIVKGKVVDEEEEEEVSKEETEAPKTEEQEETTETQQPDAEQNTEQPSGKKQNKGNK